MQNIAGLLKSIAAACASKNDLLDILVKYQATDITGDIHGFIASGTIHRNIIITDIERILRVQIHFSMVSPHHQKISAAHNFLGCFATHIVCSRMFNQVRHTEVLLAMPSMTVALLARKFVQYAIYQQKLYMP